MANWQALDLELQGVIERDVYNPEPAQFRSQSATRSV
jgi:hypothetical protein